MKYVLYMNGRVSTCPRCSGMIRPDNEEEFKCIDCGLRLRPTVEETMNEREVVCEEVSA